MDPEEVLAFWFGQPAATPEALMAKIKRWFMGGPDMDAEVRQRFGATVDRALAGDLDAWTSTIRGRLALVLVLDQFTRNVFRNDPKTYAGDTKAQALVTDALDKGLDRELDLLERTFLCMPLVHAENLDLQRRAVLISKENASAAAPLHAKFCAMNLEQTAKYEGIIARFGRFPHRNAILGRVSTPDEETLLVDWADKGPPTEARS